MEFFPIIPFFFLLLFIQLCRILTKSQTPSKNLPPGPWKFPIIGNLHHLLGSSLPHHVLRALTKKYGPIMHLQLGELSTIVISSTRLAKELFTTHDLAISNRPGFLATKIILYNNSDLAFAPYSDFWRQMHKICILELLSPKKVASFSLIREEEVSRFIDSIQSSFQSTVDLGTMIYSLQNKIACRAVFGGKCNQDIVIDIILEMISYMGGFDAANLFPSFRLLPYLNGMMFKMKKTQRKLDCILNDIIDDHSKHIGGITRNEEDLVDVLLRVKKTGGLEFPLTLDNIKGITLDMFASGTETAATTIEWAMSEMIRNPRVMEKAQVELRDIFKGKKVIHETDIRKCSYLNMVIKETLRLRNPFALLLPRQSRKQFELEGYTIPEKTNIIVNFSAIARDPDHWKEAEIFLPERFENSSIDFKGTNFEFIPFGAGRRMCPGITFGMASVELVLAQLLYHFDWELPNKIDPKDLDMAEVFGLTVRKQNSLCLVATPYSST